MRSLIQTAVLLALLLSLSGCATFLTPGEAEVVSVSEDGRYVVSSHSNRRLILWDVESRNRQVISRNANIFSAYFIQGRDLFMWQDLDDVVRVQTLDGEVVREFEHFPVYGHLMASDLETYFSSDVGLMLYKGWGEEQQTFMYDSRERGRFLGSLLNLSYDENRQLLFSFGRGSTGADSRSVDMDDPLGDGPEYAGAVLWDATTGEPLLKFPGLASKGHGEISPDGQWVVATAENFLGYVWDIETGERRWQLSAVTRGVWDFDKQEYDDSRFIDRPEGLPGPARFGVIKSRFVGAFFLDEEYFIRVPYRSYHAILHHIDEPYTLAYLDLGRRPDPGTDRFVPSVDASVEANLLVTGQRRPWGGINVYRFDPETETLEKVWSPRGWLAF